MQEAITNYQRCCFIQHVLLAVLVIFPQLAIAQSSNAQPTIVVVSMMEQSSALYWYQGEEQIRDELRMSNLNVISTSGTPYASLNMQDELKRAADTQDADVAILIYKTDSQNARLMVYAKGSDNEAQMLSEYDFPISDTEDAAEIVGLKTAEVVQVAVNDAEQTLLMPTVQPRRSMPPRLKLALGLAISGAVVMGVGGVFHGLTNYYDNEAGKAFNSWKDALVHNSPRRMDEAAKNVNYNDDKAGNCQVGAVIGYVTGGILLTLSAATFYSYRMKKRENNAPLTLSVHGTGVTWEF